MTRKLPRNLWDWRNLPKTQEGITRQISEWLEERKLLIKIHPEKVKNWLLQ